MSIKRTCVKPVHATLLCDTCGADMMHDGNFPEQDKFNKRIFHFTHHCPSGHDDVLMDKAYPCIEHEPITEGVKR